MIDMTRQHIFGEEYRIGFSDAKRYYLDYIDKELLQMLVESYYEDKSNSDELARKLDFIRGQLASLKQTIKIVQMTKA